MVVQKEIMQRYGGAGDMFFTEVKGKPQTQHDTGDLKVREQVSGYLWEKYQEEKKHECRKS